MPAPDFETIPVGAQPAVCSRVFDLGQQPGFHEGRVHKVAIMWELAAIRREGPLSGKPFHIAKIYTASLSATASLRRDIESWRGRGFSEHELKEFDLERLVGANCTLELVEKKGAEGAFVSVASVSRPPLGQKVLAVKEPYFTPSWIRKMMFEGARSASHQEKRQEEEPSRLHVNPLGPQQRPQHSTGRRRSRGDSDGYEPASATATRGLQYRISSSTLEGQKGLLPTEKDQ